jgi:hypothetical protein
MVAAISPAGLLSHYHPFDPSTKWLRHGTLGIWLIIRVMWLCGHGNAWHCGGWQAIVRGNKLVTYPRHGCSNNSKPCPAGSRPGYSLIFGGFAHVRRR